MASKEFTVFVIDLSPSMGNKAQNREVNDLEYGLSFYNDFISKTLLAKRKQDRVGVVLCHSPVTKNPHANESSLNNIEVLYEDTALTYDRAKNYREKIRVNREEIRKQEGDCLEALLVGIGIFKDTMKYKFKRQLILITNAESKVHSFGSKLAKATVPVISQLQAQIRLIVIDFNLEDHGKSSSKLFNENEWKLQVGAYGGIIVDCGKLNESLLYDPPLKKVRPVASYSGLLRLGAKLSRPNEGTDDLVNESDRLMDDSGLTMQVQVYPAIKTNKLISGHQYVLNGGRLDQVRPETTYYLKRYSGEDKDAPQMDDDDPEGAREDEYVKEEIKRGDWEDGYKYSNMDLIALNKDLLESTKLQTEAGLDVIGFIDSYKVPYAYFMDESSYVVANNVSVGNSSVFFAFCEIMLDLKLYSIVRYVPKKNSEIQLCFLIPTKFQRPKGDDMGCVMVRAPFKEDERIGRFPSLTSIRSTREGTVSSDDDDDDNDIHNESEDDPDYDSRPEWKKFLPSKKTNDSMKAFIEAMSIDEHKESLEDPWILKNQKITNSNLEDIFEEKDIDSSVGNILSASSPAIHKFNHNLKRIITKSLAVNDLSSFLEDENFVSRNLLSVEEDSHEKKYGTETTNFFNLYNILSINTPGRFDFFARLNSRASDKGKEVLKNLDIKYLEKATENKKRKRESINSELFENPSRRPNYGKSEGVYDQALDLDKLLK